MAEYIEREQVYESLYANADGEQSFDMASARVGAYERIEAIPSADVQPVVHGHWVRCKTNIGLYQCSRCNFPEHEQYGILGNYCRNCGARMDGEENGKNDATT